RACRDEILAREVADVNPTRNGSLSSHCGRPSEQAGGRRTGGRGKHLPGPSRPRDEKNESWFPRRTCAHVHEIGADPAEARRGGLGGELFLDRDGECGTRARTRVRACRNHHKTGYGGAAVLKGPLMQRPRNTQEQSSRFILPTTAEGILVTRCKAGSHA